MSRRQNRYPLQVLAELVSVCWISATELELRYAHAMFDQAPEAYADSNQSYYIGTIGGAWVVLVALYNFKAPNAASNTGCWLIQTFQRLKFGVLVGIGAGVNYHPKEYVKNREWDLKLGDIVFSEPSVTGVGVVLYDAGIETKNGFQPDPRYRIPPPDRLLVSIAQQLRGQSESRLRGLYADAVAVAEGHGRLAEGSRRMPSVQGGLIATSLCVVKDAKYRDARCKALGQFYRAKVRCIEMEAAGIMDKVPCLVIRGISDLADCNKSNKGQQQAACSAALYARMLLCQLPSNIVYRGPIQVASNAVPRAPQQPYPLANPAPSRRPIRTW